MAHMMSLWERKVRHKYGLFKQNKGFYRISSFYEKRIDRVKTKQLKQNIFK